MPFDDGIQLGEVLEWLASVISSLGFFLPIALILLFNLFGKKDKAKQENHPSGPPRRQSTMTTQRPAPQPATPQPSTPQPVPSFPFDGLPSWMEVETPPTTPAPQRSRTVAPTSQWGSGFSERRADDEPLRWGSAFDDNDAAAEDRSLKWGSAFDQDREKTKWGFDDNHWGSGFAPKKRESEPKITVG